MAVWGFRRGLLSGLIGTAKYAVGVPVSLFVSHQYYQAVYDKLVEPKALAKVQEKIAGASGVDTFMAALQEKMKALPQALQGDFDFAALKKGSAKTAADFVTDGLPAGKNRIIFIIVHNYCLDLLAAFRYAKEEAGQKDGAYPHQQPIGRCLWAG